MGVFRPDKVEEIILKRVPTRKVLYFRLACKGEKLSPLPFAFAFKGEEIENIRNGFYFSLLEKIIYLEFQTEY